MALGQQDQGNPFYGQTPNYQFGSTQESLMAKSPPVARASLPDTAARLAVEVESLHKIISVMEDRLIGTLLPTVPTDGQVPRNTVSEPGSPMRDHLSSVLGEVRRVSQRLHDLNSRLDL